MTPFAVSEPISCIASAAEHIAVVAGGESNESESGSAAGGDGVPSENTVKHGLIATLIRKLQDAIVAFEKASLAEFVELFNRPARMLYLHFLSGVARGFGIAVGLSLVSALFVAVVVYLARLNLPVIGELIAEIARIVQAEMSDGR